jgi:hypothetical protein
MLIFKRSIHWVIMTYCSVYIKRFVVGASSNKRQPSAQSRADDLRRTITAIAEIRRAKRMLAAMPPAIDPETGWDWFESKEGGNSIAVVGLRARSLQIETAISGGLFRCVMANSDINTPRTIVFSRWGRNCAFHARCSQITSPFTTMAVSLSLWHPVLRRFHSLPANVVSANGLNIYIVVLSEGPDQRERGK